MNKWLMNNCIKCKLPRKVEDTEEILNEAYAFKEFKIVQTESILGKENTLAKLQDRKEHDSTEELKEDKTWSE